MVASVQTDGAQLLSVYLHLLKLATQCNVLIAEMQNEEKNSIIVMIAVFNKTSFFKFQTF